MIFSSLSRWTFLGLLQHRPQTRRWLSRIVLSMGTVSLLAAPATAFPSFNLLNRHDYRRCAEGLRDAGIAPKLSAEACAGVIRPRDLSECVVSITNTAAISSEEALVGCVSVRRPRELGICVTGIVTVASSADPLNVLNSCALSLLPERYSFCVIGLAEVHQDLAVDDLLETCLNPPEQFTDLDLQLQVEPETDQPQE
ncbi:MAG: hypothetical protein WAN66_24750 [Limnoraphis robusta]|uniref:hypothetical protein n=1 Tax=Limnoraphis robusta TaxID=1118279 RepID=UPI002B1EBFF5|nr:hypothetical protein [Limnoraphis robusta]MEA5499317.1 hypothetical protein [Limnoraphis robusta BA-68 BA1]MEA5539296.1 hypothetical protein [Limnoraphis robusta Tam1]